MRPPTDDELRLYEAARGAARHAYAPVFARSRSGPRCFRPAAASPILGVNVENASYGLTSCAERNAVFAAVAAGLRDFSAIAVHAEAGSAPAVRRLPAGAGRVLAVDDRRLPERRRGRRLDGRRASARPLRAVSDPEHRSGVVALAGTPERRQVDARERAGRRARGGGLGHAADHRRRRALGVVQPARAISSSWPTCRASRSRSTGSPSACSARWTPPSPTPTRPCSCSTAASPIGPGDRYIAERLLRPGSAPCVDRREQDRRSRADRVLPALAAAAALGDARSIHPVSALKGDGVEALLADLVALLPAGPAYFPDGVTTDQPARASHRRAGARAGASRSRATRCRTRSRSRSTRCARGEGPGRWSRCG